MKLQFTFSFFVFCTAIMAQWTDVSTGKIGPIHQSWTVSEDTVIATGNAGKIYYSYDGGQIFDSVVTIYNFGEWFNDIQFLSSGKGYVCGGTAFGTHFNFLASTDDGGLSWDSLTSNQFTGSSFKQIDFATDQIGFIQGENDLLLKTLDGGQNFTQVQFQPSGQIDAIILVDSQTGFISTSHVDLTGSLNFRILKTTDQGLTWKQVYLNSINGTGFSDVKNINSFYFNNSLNGHAVGNNGLVLKTTDGGESWSSQTLINDTTFFNEVYFINDDLGYALGRYAFGGFSRSTWITSDAGQNWSEYPYSFSSISFANDSLGYAIQDGVLFKTTQTGHIGVNEDLYSSMSLFPNPVSKNEVLHLENIGDSKIVEIYDAFGRMVMKNVYEQPLQLTNFKSGIYFLKMGGVTTQAVRFIVVD